MSIVAKDPESQVITPYGTPEWIRERVGYLTASNMGRAMAFLKDGKTESAERRKLKIQILAERLADSAVDHYVSPDMQWGLDMEPAAKKEYVKLTGTHILDGGFVKHPKIEFFGATPDAFIHHDGLLEIKCPRTETHTGYLLERKVPDQYRPQILAQLACTGRKWADFMSYDPRIPNPKFQSLIVRFQPEKAEIEKVEAAAIQFLKEVETMFEIINS